MSHALVEWVPEEWREWNLGMGRCPYCRDLQWIDFQTICDCWQFECEEARLGRSRDTTAGRPSPESAPGGPVREEQP